MTDRVRPRDAAAELRPQVGIAQQGRACQLTQFFPIDSGRARETGPHMNQPIASRIAGTHIVRAVLFGIAVLVGTCAWAGKTAAGSSGRAWPSLAGRTDRHRHHPEPRQHHGGRRKSWHAASCDAGFAAGGRACWSATTRSSATWSCACAARASASRSCCWPISTWSRRAARTGISIRSR